jgi:threonine aldolase
LDAAAAFVPPTPAEREARLAACSRSLLGNGRRSPDEITAEVAEVLGDVTPDRYGSGGVVAELEAEMCEILGKPAAVFMPSGTMAQQIAMRVHADRLGRRTVLWHPTAHPEKHEDQAAVRLHGLSGRPVGDPEQLITLSDLEDVAEYAGVLLLELPQREIGGQLPSWDDLVAQTSLARSHGTVLHLDGARLWECVPHYGRSEAEISSLFDSVYVSFYKGLGGVAGCALAGDEQLVDEAREWRHRHGGTLFHMWPLAAPALAGARLRRPRMTSYVEHARAIAALLSDVDGVELVPDPPVTNMFHLYLRVEPGAFAAAAKRFADEDDLYVWPTSYSTVRPRWQAVELSVGDATLQFTPTEVRDVIAALLG